MTRYKLRIPCPGGKIETVINDPGPERAGVALVAHPHPLHGGTMDNKVVETAARTILKMGFVAVRPNFRGVGMSEGDYDHGNGEVDDMQAIAEFVMGRYEALPLCLIGFSFGAFVQTRLSRRIKADRLVLIGPAVNLFDFGAPGAPAMAIHGAEDELVPLAGLERWADTHQVPVVAIPGADHFFNRKLEQLKATLTQLCHS